MKSKQKFKRDSNSKVEVAESLIVKLRNLYIKK